MLARQSEEVEEAEPRRLPEETRFIFLDAREQNPETVSVISQKCEQFLKTGFPPTKPVSGLNSKSKRKCSCSKT